MVLPLTCALPWSTRAPLGVGDLGGAEGGFQVLRERQHDLVRRRGHGAADQRAGVIEEGMGPRRDGCERQRSSGEESEKFSHGDTSELELLRWGSQCRR